MSGTTTVDGQSMDLSGTKGFITVGSTDWGKLARPDYCNVTYQIMDHSPLNFSNAIPSLQSPTDVNFVLGANPKEHQVAINASTDTDVTKVLIGYALQGIFKAHEKAIGWVIGAV